MGKINSKTKGKVGELEFVKKCKEQGYLNVRRTAQYNGKELDSKADVVNLPYIHAEVKRVERLNIYDAVEQAQRDCKLQELPTVFHRKNNKEWLATMPLSEWFKIYNIYANNALNTDYFERKDGQMVINFKGSGTDD